MQRARNRRWFELEAPAPERLGLETTPRASTVSSYVLTRAAERSWALLNQHLAVQKGAVFWIGGAAGCGKTHFLNYVIALEGRAGTLEVQNARALVCGLELAGRLNAAEAELYVLSVLAEQISGERGSSGDLFRQLSGAAGLKVALESARRTGIKAITVAIDFGTAECEGAADFIRMLAEVAASFSAVRLTVIGAGRGAVPQAARELCVAAHDFSEEAAVAIRRARRLLEDGASEAAIAYAGIDTEGAAPEAIFPFHPASARALKEIADRLRSSGTSTPGAAIAQMARLAREALAAAHADRGGGAPARLVYPADLAMKVPVASRLSAILSEAGRTAWKIARDRIAGLSAYEEELAREIIDTMVVENVCGGAALTIEELKSRLPTAARGGAAAERVLAAVSESVRRIEALSGGVIRLEAGAARFDPDAGGAAEIAAFNAALELARRFDPHLTLARGRGELEARLERLNGAMAEAVEQAAGTREALAAAYKEAKLEMPAASRDAIERYIALAESGAAAMIEAAAADRSYLAAAMQIARAYEAIAAACEAIPRMRAMREYLDATGLRAAAVEGGGARESEVACLETECELLRVELGPRLLAGPPPSLDALEARFQKFKWTYVQCYLSAHERWRAKMERLALVVGDARRHFEALSRLNAIGALGPPEGKALGARVAELGARVVGCENGDAIAPETTPQCSSCGFRLGAQSPEPELEAAMEEIRRALEVKLAALSHSMIARLIRLHDREHRLEGFLKITQAAQTDALVRVLDEKLARYLGEVLDENKAAAPLEPARVRRLRPR